MSRQDLDAPAYVVASGNPGDGFTLHGPFPSHTDAVTWAEGRDDCDLPWWVLPVHRPPRG